MSILNEDDILNAKALKFIMHDLWETFLIYRRLYLCHPWHSSKLKCLLRIYVVFPEPVLSHNCCEITMQMLSAKSVTKLNLVKLLKLAHSYSSLTRERVNMR